MSILYYLLSSFHIILYFIIIRLLFLRMSWIYDARCTNIEKFYEFKNMDILQFLVSYIVHCNILQSPLSSFQISFVGGLESISLSKMAETGHLDNEI